MKIKNKGEEVVNSSITKRFSFEVENSAGEKREFILESYQSDDGLGGYGFEETWYWVVDGQEVEIDMDEEEKILEWLGEDIVWDELQDELNDNL